MHADRRRARAAEDLTVDHLALVMRFIAEQRAALDPFASYDRMARVVVDLYSDLDSVRIDASEGISAIEVLDRARYAIGAQISQR